MFSEYLSQFDWDETTESIHAKTSADVEAALRHPRSTAADFMALNSPAAAR